MSFRQQIRFLFVHTGTLKHIGEGVSVASLLAAHKQEGASYHSWLYSKGKVF